MDKNAKPMFLYPNHVFTTLLYSTLTLWGLPLMYRVSWSFEVQNTNNTQEKSSMTALNHKSLLCFVVHNDGGDLSASLSGQQMFGRPSQMLAVLCGCVKYPGWQERAHKNSGEDHEGKLEWPSLPRTSSTRTFIGFWSNQSKLSWARPRPECSNLALAK